MEECTVDPDYEYQAPQFFDFCDKQAEEDNADSWFDSNPGYGGGVPVNEPESEAIKATVTVPEQEEKYNSKRLDVESVKIDLFCDQDQCKNQKITREDSDNRDEKPELFEQPPEGSNAETNQNSQPELPETGSNKCANETKTRPKKAQPSNLVSSWESWNKKKTNACQEASGTDSSDKDDMAENKSKRVTRALKRNHTLNVSASSAISSHKQGELLEHRGNSGRNKRPRSLCSNPEKKHLTLTVPVTPECLKRQKTAKPAMIKLKTTEEMEMEQIAKLRKMTKQHMKVNESSMKKAISCTSYHPVRTITDPTQPQEFHFETDKRVKPHPMTTRADDAEKEFLKSLRQHPPSPTWKNRNVTVPKPFNLSGSGSQTKRKHSAIEKDGHETEAYESVAYQVYKFQTKTPPRFRTKKANEANSKTAAEQAPKLKLTCPKTPNLSTNARGRALPPDVLSREEVEEKEAEAMRSYRFKARPFDRRIVECDGLLGVKKPAEEEKHLTRPLPFVFESDERLESRKQEKPGNSQEEEKVQFKALPQPNFEKVFRPQLKHERTEPKPFSFEEKDKERWQKKENKIQQIYKEEERLREFKAQPLPPDSPDTLPAIASKSGTSFKPFTLNTENRGAIKAEKWIQKVKSEIQNCHSKKLFKANPNKVTQEAPFVPQKSQKALTEVSEFALNTERRAERREELETFKKEREKVDDELRKQREAAREKEEKEAIALLRKKLVHKAQPIHKYKRVVVKPSDKPLTQASSPAWSELKRRRVDNYR